MYLLCSGSHVRSWCCGVMAQEVMVGLFMALCGPEIIIAHAICKKIRLRMEQRVLSSSGWGAGNPLAAMLISLSTGSQQSNCSTFGVFEPNDHRVSSLKSSQVWTGSRIRPCPKTVHERTNTRQVITSFFFMDVNSLPPLQGMQYTYTQPLCCERSLGVENFCLGNNDMQNNLIPSQ